MFYEFCSQLHQGAAQLAQSRGVGSRNLWHLLTRAELEPREAPSPLHVGHGRLDALDDRDARAVEFELSDERAAFFPEHERAAEPGVDGVAQACGGRRNAVESAVERRFLPSCPGIEWARIVPVTAIIPIVVSPEAKTLRVAAMVAGSASLRRQLSLVEDGSWF